MSKQLNLLDDIEFQKKVAAYEEKQQAKADYYNEKAIQAAKNSRDFNKQASQISSFIPFGQPILVGHHSENRHRRDLGRINNYTRKSIEESDKSAYYANKAQNTENSKVISSDDPEAVIKLKAKLNKLQRIQDAMKKINAEYRKCKGDVDKMDISEEAKTNLKRAKENYRYDISRFKPFESYKLSNNNQNMSTIKKRIKILEKQHNDETTEKTINGVQVIDNVEENRLQLFFDGKPSEEVRKQLKSNGFRWSPYNGCWQAFRSNAASYNAKEILNNI